MKKLLSILLVALSLGLWQGAMAAAPEAKPFAEKKVVLQISDPNPFKQTLVLNVAGNLVKHYGADNIDVEIVAFGPGLRLLMAGNSNSSRIQSLASEGVRFAACANTVKKFTTILEEKPELNKDAYVTPGGAVRIIDLVSQGYVLIKP
jgi:intracellular sulfur oxidation DsrE/DsrF family protein